MTTYTPIEPHPISGPAAGELYDQVSDDGKLMLAVLDGAFDQSACESVCAVRFELFERQWGIDNALDELRELQRLRIIDFILKDDCDGEFVHFSRWVDRDRLTLAVLGPPMRFITDVEQSDAPCPSCPSAAGSFRFQPDPLDDRDWISDIHFAGMLGTCGDDDRKPAA